MLQNPLPTTSQPSHPPPSLSEEALKRLRSDQTEPALSMEKTDSYHSTSSAEHGSMVDSHGSVPTADEYETGSEMAEPVTPVSDTHNHPIHHHEEQHHHDASTMAANAASVDNAVQTPKTHPLIVKIPATPPQRHSPSRQKSESPDKSTSSPPKTLPDSVPKSATLGKRSASRRIAAFFHRTNTSSGTRNELPTLKHGATFSGEESQELRPDPPRRPSSFTLTSRTSPFSSKSVTPPSPGSPVITPYESAPLEQTMGAYKTPERAATGLQATEPRGRIRFTQNLKPERNEGRRRSTSMNGVSQLRVSPSISRPAETGMGLKARRMSTTLPEGFYVDTAELTDEFVSASRVPLKKGKMAGAGAAGTVRLMCRKSGPSDKIFAAKEFRKRDKAEESEEEYVQKVKSEFAIANSLHHPNIVETVRLCSHNGRWTHVMEYCDQGDLFSLVNRGYMKDPDKLCLFKQLLRGISYLHKHGIAHRDIKVENLLMTHEGQLKITDFGISDVFCGEHPGLRSSGGVCGKNMGEIRLSPPGICGSLPYIAPEVLEKKGPYDPRKVDVWSAAVSFLTIKCNGHAWDSAERKHPMYAAFMLGWEKFFEKHPERLITDETGVPKCGPIWNFMDNNGLRKLLLRMMHPDPKLRYTIDEALSDRWLKTVECCGLEESSCVGALPPGQGVLKKCNKNAFRKVHNHLPPLSMMGRK